MGGSQNTFETLHRFLEDMIGTFSDVRKGKNTVYEIRDAVLSAFSVFFLQCPSFLSHQKAMRIRKGKNNANTIFGIHKIPTDTHIRNLLDPIPPELLFPVYHKVLSLH